MEFSNTFDTFLLRYPFFKTHTHSGIMSMKQHKTGEETSATQLNRGSSRFDTEIERVKDFPALGWEN